VSMLDKIVGNLRSGTDMPTRRVRRYDCMRFGLKASDAVTDTVIGLPDSLCLNPEIVKPMRYFDPNGAGQLPCGFTYVEVYDPAYWMGRNFLTSQPCFHPMYRMRAYNTVSALNNETFAIWVMKYSDIVPQTKFGGVAAPSVHFGTELWFFRQDQVDKILKVVLRKWQILKTIP